MQSVMGSNSDRHAGKETICEDVGIIWKHAEVTAGRPVEFREVNRIDNASGVAYGRFVHSSMDCEGPLVVEYASGLSDPVRNAVLAHECCHITRMYSVDSAQRPRMTKVLELPQQAVPLLIEKLVDNIEEFPQDVIEKAAAEEKRYEKVSGREFRNGKADETKRIVEWQPYLARLSDEKLRTVVKCWKYIEGWWLSLLDKVELLLVNNPQDIQINRCLFRDYPELRDPVRELLAVAFGTDVTDIPERGVFVPEKLYVCEYAMRFAFRKTMGDLIGQDFVAPFARHKEIKTLGVGLTDIVSRQSRQDCVGDHETARRWAEELGINGWF